MEPYQELVIEEKKELDKKRHKLSEFFKTGFFKGMPVADQSVMRDHLKAMTDYSECLGKRIESFETCEQKES